jgi:signal transduction histidine kinase
MNRDLKPKAVDVQGCADQDSAARRAWAADTTESIAEQASTEDALREADRHKSEFLAWLSHELRNPLGIIRTSLALIERTGVESETGRKAISVISRQAAHMDRLVDDLLDITRISKGKVLLRRTAVMLNDVIRSSADDYRQLFAIEGLSFHVQITAQPLRAYVDTARIQQIVGNLLQNALKFTAPDGHVELSVRSGKDNDAIIEVRDNGVGVSEHLIDSIFEPMMQDRRTIEHTRGGLGLGLPLVKGLVEMHGGTVSASSSGPGGGAVFTIHLPLDRRRPRR